MHGICHSIHSPWDVSKALYHLFLHFTFNFHCCAVHHLTVSYIYMLIPLSLLWQETKRKNKLHCFASFSSLFPYYGVFHIIQDSVEHAASANFCYRDAATIKGYISSRLFHLFTHYISSYCCCTLCCPICTILWKVI